MEHLRLFCSADLKYKDVHAKATSVEAEQQFKDEHSGMIQEYMSSNALEVIQTEPDVYVRLMPPLRRLAAGTNEEHLMNAVKVHGILDEVLAQCESKMEGSKRQVQEWRRSHGLTKRTASKRRTIGAGSSVDV